MKLLPIAFLALAACAPANAQQHDGARVLAQLEKADANHDGAVSRSEFVAFRANQFSRLDRNKDGYLTDNDMPARVKSKLPPEFSIDALKASFDADKDNRVSQNEFVSGPTKAFDRIDTNGDDVVTEAEFAAARALLEAGR